MAKCYEQYITFLFNFILAHNFLIPTSRNTLPNKPVVKRFDWRSFTAANRF